MNTIKIYISSLWRHIKRLFKCGGEGFLLVGKVLVVVMLVMGYGESKGQAIKPLKIGDTIPEELWNMPFPVVNHPEGKSTIKLSDYEGHKLIILDFWATWCGSCISGMTKIDSIKKSMNDNFVIIPITEQSQVPVLDAFAKIELLKKSNLFSIVEDKMLGSYFPHRIVPHTVWLSPKRKIIAISDGKDANEKNIKQVIKGGKIEVHVKRDVLNFNTDSSIFFRNAYGIDKEIQVQSTFSKYLPGIPTLSGIKKKLETTHIYGANQSLFHLYCLAYPNLIYYKSARVDCESSLEDKYFVSRSKSQNENGLFSYELLAKGLSKEKQQLKISQDLDFFFKVKTGFVQKKVKCLILSDLTARTVKSKSVGANLISIDGLASAIEHKMGLPTINESKSRKVPAELKESKMINLQEVNNRLSSYGLILTEAVRKIELFQIKEDVK